MKLKIAGFALAFAVSTLAVVATTNAKDTRVVLTKEQCKASCQAGFNRCGVSGKDKNGNRCNTTCCQKELSDCQTILCGHLPAE